MLQHPWSSCFKIIPKTRLVISLMQGRGWLSSPKLELFLLRLVQQPRLPLPAGNLASRFLLCFYALSQPAQQSVSRNLDSQRLGAEHCFPSGGYVGFYYCVYWIPILEYNFFSILAMPSSGSPAILPFPPRRHRELPLLALCFLSTFKSLALSPCHHPSTHC